MSPVTTPRPTSSLLLVAAYLGFLIGGLVLFYVIIYAMEEFAGTPFPANNSMGLILIYLAAMMTGQMWYNRELAAPSSGRKWGLAFLMTVVTVAIQAGMIVLLKEAMDELGYITRELGGSDQMLIIGAFATVIVLEFLLLRAGIWWGVRGAIKQEERKAAKAAAR